MIFGIYYQNFFLRSTVLLKESQGKIVSYLRETNYKSYHPDKFNDWKGKIPLNFFVVPSKTEGLIQNSVHCTQSFSIL